MNSEIKLALSLRKLFHIEAYAPHRRSIFNSNQKFCKYKDMLGE